MPPLLPVIRPMGGFQMLNVAGENPQKVIHPMGGFQMSICLTDVVQLLLPAPWAAFKVRVLHRCKACTLSAPWAAFKASGIVPAKNSRLSAPWAAFKNGIRLR